MITENFSLAQGIEPESELAHLVSQDIQETRQDIQRRHAALSQQVRQELLGENKETRFNPQESEAARQRREETAILQRVSRSRNEELLNLAQRHSALKKLQELVTPVGGELPVRQLQAEAQRIIEAQLKLNGGKQLSERLKTLLHQVISEYLPRIQDDKARIEITSQLFSWIDTALLYLDEYRDGPHHYGQVKVLPWRQLGFVRDQQRLAQADAQSMRRLLSASKRVPAGTALTDFSEYKQAMGDAAKFAVEALCEKFNRATASGLVATFEYYFGGEIPGVLSDEWDEQQTALASFSARPVVREQLRSYVLHPEEVSRSPIQIETQSRWQFIAALLRIPQSTWKVSQIERHHLGEDRISRDIFQEAIYDEIFDMGQNGSSVTTAVSDRTITEMAKDLFYSYRELKKLSLLETPGGTRPQSAAPPSETAKVAALPSA